MQNVLFYNISHNAHRLAHHHRVLYHNRHIAEVYVFSAHFRFINSYFLKTYSEKPKPLKDNFV